MAFTQEDIEAIDEAIATGVLEVQFADGKRTRYRSINELERAKYHIEGEITKALGKRPRRGVRMNVTKGL
jgi:hypothetical protein